LADVCAAKKYEKEHTIVAHVQEQAEGLAAQTYPMKDFELVQEFVAFFLGCQTAAGDNWWQQPG
jgi:hypothetical protein